MAQPLRRCAGCGRRAPQDELVRFAVRDGELVPGRTAPGRGAYTCRSLACFERASMRRGFAHALRRPVRVDPSLARIYTGESHA
ncbi:MAG: YlxR family protein [Actinobacteria bacterium]|nr:YlxR family protein [Actinomycetota bacterium]MBV8479085.1 YlxR family protein [Actinomycetota bacterium]